MARITEVELTQKFHYVLSSFFDQGEVEGEWKVLSRDAPKSVSGCRSYGEADEENMTIWINAEIDPSELVLVLIHEIAHAATLGDFHGERWLSRMEKAATRADELGEVELAKSIRSEVIEYRDHSEEQTADDIYVLVRDFVWDLPNATFEHVLNYLEGTTAMESSRLLKACPRLREAYEIAKQEVGAGS